MNKILFKPKRQDYIYICCFVPCGTLWNLKLSADVYMTHTLLTAILWHLIIWRSLRDTHPADGNLWHLIWLPVSTWHRPCWRQFVTFNADFRSVRDTHSWRQRVTSDAVFRSLRDTPSWRQFVRHLILSSRFYVTHTLLTAICDYIWSCAPVSTWHTPCWRQFVDI